MKNNIVYLLIVLLFASCEDVVNVDLPTSPPKLVIDAVIKWQKGTTGNEQKIILSTTADYYNIQIPPAIGATVFITNSSNIVFNFIEIPNTGEYICTDFVPIVNEEYTLTVIYNSNTYNATDKLIATPVITNVQQQSVPGIGDEEDTEIKYFFEDNGLENNFYLLGVKRADKNFPEYGAVTDEFFQGNTMFGYYRTDDLETNDIISLSLQGISQRYYNYMIKLINIVGITGGNPFATAPATLRGNITNTTNIDNYPLGYFSLGETDSIEYIVE